MPMMDADEVVSDELRSEIAALLRADDAGASAFLIKRRNFFLGRWIKHAGFYPDRKLRLFKRGVAKCEERSVHESIPCSGKTATLNGDLYHYAYPTLVVYLEHMNRYSRLASKDMLSRGKNANTIVDVLLRPMYTFLYNYVVRLGFIDGREGFLLNLYHAMYVSSKYAKLQNEQKYGPEGVLPGRELDAGMFPGSWRRSWSTKRGKSDER